ncbi:MAG: 2-amino-4-hydroxy-6-hydroxymethyldihydropteridine diphosphokinase [Chromatiaceae bacterium]|nr:2-amino-4-hydroxy-6-hydroxymethyldihydropteridine diphosphokinase [Chromatiaceae bacterium]
MGAEQTAHLAYVAIGANLAGPEGQVRRALVELGRLTGSRMLRASPLYLTKPLGPANQPDYVNAVVSLETQLSPRNLLLALQAIENAHGRVREQGHWGPRPLDLDILLYGEDRVDEPDLHVPHPEMSRRAFVLVPLADIAPGDLAIPGQGRLAALLAACPRDGIRLLALARPCEGGISLAESPPA